MVSIIDRCLSRTCVILVTAVTCCCVHSSVSTNTVDRDRPGDNLLFIPRLAGTEKSSIFNSQTMNRPRFSQGNVITGDANSAMTDVPRNETNSLPGMKLRLSSTLLNTVTAVATDHIFSHVTGMMLPDQRGKSGKIIYEFTDMKVNQFVKPSTTVSINPGSGLTLSARGTQIKVDGKFKVIRIIPFRGKFDLLIEFNTLTLSFVMGVDSSGHPTISSTGCSCQIAKVTIHLHGSAAWIIDLFKNKIERAIRNDVSTVACKLARNGIDVSVRDGLAKLPLQRILAGVLLFDYRLSSSPSFDQRGFIETEHKGEMFYMGDSTEAPFQPEALPDPGAADRMLTLWISEYTFNTVGYVLYKLNLLQLIITDAALPLTDRGFLNTTCTQGVVCFGQLFPAIQTIYPNAVVELGISAGDKPQLTFSPTGVDCHFVVVVSFDARLANKSLAHLFKASFTTTAPNVQVFINGSQNVVRFSVDKISAPTIVIIDSDVGLVSTSVLTWLFNEVTKRALPMIKEIGEQGFVLPQVVENWKLENVGLDLESHCFRFTTDIKPL